MSRGRRSLRDFDDEAIAAPGRPAGDEPVSAAAQRSGTSGRPVVYSSAGAAGKTRMGIYFHPEIFEQARSAYLVDFDALPDAPDSFARWIAHALDTHAGRSAQKRRAIVGALPEEAAAGAGFSRSFEVPAVTIADMNTAISTDRRAGRVTSRSQFAAEAIRDGIEAAKIRAGGVLPPAPARLPNKPVK